jgi:hypothetical protein
MRRAICLLMLLLPALPAGAADLKDTARSLFETAQKSVVTVRLVIKMNMGSRDQEQKLETIGTVVDASGLTVVSAAAIDPAAGLRAMMAARGGGGPKVESKINEAALLLPDGTEFEADVVLKDEALGLAFVRPREVPKGVAAIELKKARPAQILDEVVMVGRYGRAANRAAWVDLTRVRAVVHGPHPFAICSEESSAALGTIGYGADGSPLGVFVGRNGGDGESAMARARLVVLRPMAAVP